MTHKQTRILSFVMALAMILSAVGMGVPRQTAVATEETTESEVIQETSIPTETQAETEPAVTMPELTLGVSTDAVISEGGEIAYFTFTPAESGIYVFYSEANKDTYGYLYDSQMNQIAYDDDGNENLNFSIRYTLEADTTYIFGARYYSSDNVGAFPVTLVRIPSVVSVTAEPISVTEGTCGSWEQATTADQTVTPLYFYYHRLNEAACYTVTFSDGSSILASGGYFTHQGISYQVECSVEQSEAWSVGNTYPFTLTVGGVSTSSEVTIVESPIASITVDPVFVAEGIHGWYTHDYDYQEYFCYDWWNNLSYTVTMKDGSAYACSDGMFTYDDDTYYLEFCDNQDYPDKHLEVGNTYLRHIMLGPATAQAEITVVDSPIESIVIEPISLKPYSNGYEEQEEIDGQTVSYFCYNTWNLDLSYTVTFLDGTVTCGTGPNVFYHGSDHSIEIFHNQSYENQWLPGNTYTVIASVLGVDCSVQITVEEFPIQSIAVQPITLYGDLDAIWRTATDENGEKVSYPVYCWWEYLTTVVTLKDGTTVECDGSILEFEDDWYVLEYSNSQTSENAWTPGNTYTETATVTGLSVPVSITITPPVVENVVADPLVLTEGIDGHWLGTNHPETGEQIQYYHYDWQEMATYTIRFTNGETLRCCGTYFEYEGRNCYLGRKDSQVTSHWQGGNEYSVSMFLEKLEIPFQITINKSPVVKVEVQPVTVQDGIDMGSRSDIGSSQPYNYYKWWKHLSYKVTFEDGTVLDCTGTGFDYNDERISVRIMDTQAYDNQWSVGGTYTVQIIVMCVPVDVTVVVEENPVDHIEVNPIHIPEETGGYWSYGYNAANEYVGYYYYCWWDHLSYTIFFKDGTCLKQTGTEFFYDDVYCSVTHSDSQSASNPMLVGNTYLCTIKLLGAAMEVEVSINTTVAEGRYNYMVTDSGVIITGITSSLTGEVLELPETLGGQSVIGILSLGGALNNVSEIMIPDSVTMLSTNVFEYWDTPLQRLHLGSGISYIDFDMLSAATHLESITVSEDNPYYCSIDGVVYDKDVTTLIVYPLGKTDSHKVPDSVTDVSSIFENLFYYEALDIELGSGIKDYVSEDGVIYNADKTKIYCCSPAKTGSYVMPDSVTEIESCAFLNSGLAEITVSANVTEIVYYTFCGSANLEKVNLPDKLESIGLSAFKNCSSLKSVDIPASLTQIDGGAYFGCDSLEAVNIKDLAAWTQIVFGNIASNPLSIARDLYLDDLLITDLVLPDTGITKISDYAFYNGSMTSVNIPGNIQSIGNSTFENSDLKSATLAEGVTDIWNRAFAETPLTSVVLPDSLTQLDYAAFRNCTQLQSAVIGSGLTEIGSSAFENTALQRITIPENVSYIGWEAFSGSKLTEVVFENDAVEIGGRAFFNCPLEEINLGDQVSFIDENAFCGSHAVTVKIPAAVTDITYRSFAFSPNLMGVVIPAGVETIHSCAFEGDLNLSHVLYTGTEEQWCAVDMDSPELLHATMHFNAVGDEFTVTESCAKIKLYCSICQRSEWINKLSPEHDFVDGVCAICGHEGYWEYEIDTTSRTVTVTGYSGPDTAISIPSTIRNMPVTAIADAAFLGRKELTSITIPSTVTSIGSKAFAQCAGLTKMILPNSVTKLGSCAFAYCYKLKNVTLSESLTEIVDQTFYRCLDLNELRIPASVTKIGAEFVKQSWINEITFCGDAPVFDQNAFSSSYPTCYYSTSNHTWTADVMQDYNGSPDWVGLDVIPPVLKGLGFTLSFEDEILVNFYFQIDDSENAKEVGMAVFNSEPGGEIDISAADECYANAVFDSVGNRYMCQTEGIAAKKMGDTRYYVAYVRLTDGTYAYSPVYSYSPRKYATNILASATSTQKQKQLCVAMLNYGASAQSYFKYNTDKLMNEELTAEQKAMVIPYSADLFTGVVPADSSKIGNFTKTDTGFSSRNATVSFEGSFSINYYFTSDSAVDGAVTFYYWTPEDYAANEKLSHSNATGSFVLADQGNGTYWAQIEGIAAKALDKTYYVAAVYYSDLELKCTGVIAYSLSKYCMNNAKDGKQMQSLASATAMYGYYAKNYFNA